MITSQYFGSSSINRARRFVFSHAIIVDPDPPNTSIITSPFLLLFNRDLSISSTGFWVGWTYCADKKKMFQSGLWSEPKVESKTESFLLSAMYQPYGWLSWSDLYDEWQSAQELYDKGLENQMIVFHNTRLARSWERKNEVAVFDEVRSRAEGYKLRVAPDGVLLITAGVDTQDNRLAVQLVGYGKGLRAWVLDYIEIMGDPAEDQVWDDLTSLINTRMLHDSGRELPVVATAIDIGGHRGEAVKNFVRSKRINNPIAVFGAAKYNARPLSKGSLQDVTWKGQHDKKGITLHSVGTIEIKHVIYSRLKNDAHKDINDRMLHFSDQLDDFYFAGLLSETWDRQKRKYIPKPGIRNEPLDTLVYSYAALHHQRVRADRYTDKDWDRLEYSINNEIPKKNLTPNATQLHKENVRPREDVEKDKRFSSFKNRFSGRFRGFR